MIKHTYKKSTTNDSKTEAAPCFALKTGIQRAKKGSLSRGQGRLLFWLWLHHSSRCRSWKSVTRVSPDIFYAEGKELVLSNRQLQLASKEMSLFPSWTVLHV
jgi:hypothetical protein